MNKNLRDGVLFVAGLLGVIHQTLIGPVEPYLLVTFAAMMGLPAFLRSDEKKGE
jgi:hypothetical protein